VIHKLKQVVMKEQAASRAPESARDTQVIDWHKSLNHQSQLQAIGSRSLSHNKARFKSSSGMRSAQATSASILPCRLYLIVIPSLRDESPGSSTSTSGARDCSDSSAAPQVEEEPWCSKRLPTRMWINIATDYRSADGAANVQYSHSSHCHRFDIPGKLHKLSLFAELRQAKC